MGTEVTSARGRLVMAIDIVPTALWWHDTIGIAPNSSRKDVLVRSTTHGVGSFRNSRPRTTGLTRPEETSRTARSTAEVSRASRLLDGKALASVCGIDLQEQPAAHCTS